MKIEKPSEFMQFKEKDYSLISIFVALCFFLSMIENLIPKPFPFLRLGLANLPLIVGVSFLSCKQYFFLAVAKVLGQGFLSGGIFSYVFFLSLAGTISSVVGMFFIFTLSKRMRYVSFVGISCLGSALSCIAQSCVGYYFVLGDGMKYVFPVFFLFSGVAGFLLGVFCNCFVKNSKFLSERNSSKIKKDIFFKSDELHTEKYSESLEMKKTFFRKRMFKKVLAILFFSFILGLIFLLLYSSSIKVKSAIFLVLFIYSAIRKKRKVGKFFIRSIVTIFSVTLLNALTPFGKILFEWKFITLTEGALLLGLRRALEFESLLFISQIASHFLQKMFTKSSHNRRASIFQLLKQSTLDFEILTKCKFKLNPKTFIKDLDKMLCDNFLVSSC